MKKAVCVLLIVATMMSGVSVGELRDVFFTGIDNILCYVGTSNIKDKSRLIEFDKFNHVYEEVYKENQKQIIKKELEEAIDKAKVRIDDISHLSYERKLEIKRELETGYHLSIDELSNQMQHLW